MTGNPDSVQAGGSTGRFSHSALSIMGQFHWGAMYGQEPIALPTWRVTTLTEGVAAGVAEILGGELQREVVAGRHAIELLTDTSCVDLVIHDPEDCYGDMRLYGACEGHEGPCMRSDLSAIVRGSRPFIRLRFGLAEDPTLGRFEFQSSSWALARDLAPVLEALRQRTVSATHCALSIEASRSQHSRGCPRGAMLGPRLRLVEVVAARGPERRAP